MRATAAGSLWGVGGAKQGSWRGSMLHRATEPVGCLHLRVFLRLLCFDLVVWLSAHSVRLVNCLPEHL